MFIRGVNYFSAPAKCADNIYSRHPVNMTELYREISCQKAVNGNNFAQGNQDFNFSIGNPTAWIPSKSYFRVRASLRAIGRAAGAVVAPAQPTTADQLAFADDAMSCLYNRTSSLAS